MLLSGLACRRDLPTEQLSKRLVFEDGLDGIAIGAALRPQPRLQRVKLGAVAPMFDQDLRCGGDLILVEHVPSPNNDSCSWSQAPQQLQHRRFGHRDAARCRPEIVARQMQKHRTAPAGDTRSGVVVDFDDEVIEMVGPLETVTALLRPEPDRLIVMAISGVLAPGVRVADGPGRKKGPRTAVAVAPPPQLPGTEAAPRGAAIALALVCQDSAPPQRHRDRQRAGRQPAPARIPGSRFNADRSKRSGASIPAGNWLNSLCFSCERAMSNSLQDIHQNGLRF
ncbi:hypothetical protein AB7M74_000945 [Bradyrhizobium japonicum]